MCWSARTRALAALAALLVALAGCEPQELLYDFDGDGSLDSSDCAPTDPAIFPGAEDVVDEQGVDNDCDGADGVDADGDGFASLDSGGDDCNDDEPGAHPGAEEVPDDGLDNDCVGGDATCDGDLDGVHAPLCGGADCDDDNSLFFPGADELCDGLDGNCDGEVAALELDDDGDGVRGCEGDCDDGDPAIGPGQPELCDGLDDDCDGVIPDDEQDADGDFSTPCDGDCDDEDPASHPAADELCDGLDNDCDGEPAPDEEDLDGDTDPACSDCDDGDDAQQTFDEDGDGATTCDGDCDDLALAVYPGGVDAWGDGVDGNCDGADGLDADGDSWAANGVPADCDDDAASPDAASTWPGAADAAGDGIDQDCDGLDGVDADGDGVASVASGGLDCDDDPASALAPLTFPGADDSVGNGADTDCDGVDGVDDDGDGVASTGSGGDDCNDDAIDPDAPSTFPGATDSSGDGIDQDCDGVDGVDADGDGVASEASGGLDCNDDPADPLAPVTLPGADDSVGNGVDTDCDGIDGIDADGDGVASIGSGGPDCADDAADPNAPTTFPGATDLSGDGIDQDCDGVDGVDADGDGVASEASGGLDCNDDPADPLAPVTLPGADDSVGNGIDTDCDGVDGIDADGDGVPSLGSGGLDCIDDPDDPDASDVWPGAPDVVGDGVDQDCDGVDGVDEDGDGVASEASGGQDCNDDPSDVDAPFVFPGAGDAWGDGLDTSCDGVDGLDLDGDGWAANAGDGQPDCDDSDAFINPGNIDGWESPASGVDQNCDGGLFDVLDEADQAFTGEASGDTAGSVAFLDDVDGDGLADLLIGASQAAGNAGKSYLLYGSTIAQGGDLDLSQADVSLVGQAAWDWSHAAPAGDVDGDGLDDIVIGAPESDSGGNNAGRAYLFFAASLPSSGTLSLGSADAIFVSEGAENHAGASVASAGDVDGDGLDDILIGAPWNWEGGGYAGKAYLVLGADVGSGGTFGLSSAHASFVGSTEYNLAGSSVAPAGDVDGDGLGDILIGAPKNSEAAGWAGKMYLFLGSTVSGGGSFALDSADAALLGEFYGSEIGSVAQAGDVDGDGLDDVLIGSAASGVAYLVLGSTLALGGTTSLGDAYARFPSVQDSDHVGGALAAGDVDGDGLQDVLVGAAYGEGGRGKVYLVGGATVAAGGDIDLDLAEAAFVGEGSSDKAGGSVAVGDIDGDGLDDVLIGAGSASLIAGRTYVLLSPF